MFFAKAILLTLAVFGLASSALASPLDATVSSVSVSAPATIPSAVPTAAVSPLVQKRGDVVLSTVQGVLDNVTPLVGTLNSATSAVDVDSAVGSIVDLLSNTKVDLAGLASVDISADVNAIVSVNVNLIVALLSTLSVKDVLDLSIVSKIDAPLSAYLDALTKIKADIGVTIGHNIPAANVDVFGTLGLVLTGHILDLVQVPDL